MFVITGVGHFYGHFVTGYNGHAHYIGLYTSVAVMYPLTDKNQNLVLSNNKIGYILFSPHNQWR